MNIDFIGGLVDIISTNQADDIQRQLRLLNFSQDLSADDKEIKKKQLTIALNYLNQRGPISVGWGANPETYAELYNWFESSGHELSFCAISWALYLGYQLSGKIDAQNIVGLGKAYYDDIGKFLGFVIFLIEENVSTQPVVDSGILHGFFNYHSWQMQDLENAYDVLSGISEKAKEFVNGISKIHCNNLAFINAKRTVTRPIKIATNSGGQRLCLFTESDTEIDDEKNIKEEIYYSRSLSGTYFDHTQKIVVAEKKRDAVIKATDDVKLSQALLFQLFGWDFVTCLDISQSDSIIGMIKELINPSDLTVNSKFANDFDNPTLQNLKAFANHVLHGKFSKLIVKGFLKALSGFNFTILIKIINFEPFYIHLLSFNSLRTIFSYEHIKNYIEKFIEDETYHSMPHTRYLVGLLKNPNVQCKSEVLMVILKILSANHLTVTEEEFAPIDDNYNLIQGNVAVFLSEKRDALERKIIEFCQGNANYMDVQNLWGAQEKCINIIRWHFLAELVNSTYPTTVHELRGRIISLFITSCENNTLLDIKGFIENMPVQQNDVMRFLQEVIINIHEDVEVKEKVLFYAFNQFSPNEFVKSLTDKRISILYYCVAFAEDSLKQLVLDTINLKDNDILSLFDMAGSRQNYFEANLISINIGFYPNMARVIEALTIKILSSLDTNKSLLIEYKILTNLIRDLNQVVISYQRLVKLFHGAIDHGSADFIIMALKHRGDNQLTVADYENGIKRAVNARNWQLVALFCGMTDDSMEINQFVQPWDVPKYIAMVKDVRDPQNSQWWWRSFRNEDTLLHVAANYCSFEDFRECLHIIIKKSNRLALSLLNSRNKDLKVVACYTDNPDQAEIDAHILKKRRKFENKLIAPLYRLTGVRRQEREQDGAGDGYDNAPPRP